MKMLSLMMMFLSVSAANAAEEYFYSVPVKDQRLERYASFELKAKAKATTKDNTLTLKYKLPEELVGKSQSAIVLTGENYGNESFTLKSENAEATCQKIEERSMCTIRYSNLDINRKEVAQAIREKAVTLNEIKAREKVARIFAGDPVGVLFFTSNQKSY